MNVFIFGFFADDGEFVAEGLFGSLKESTKTIKYWALTQEKYEVWEYPSGAMYAVRADRTVDEQLESSMPGDTTWLPKFELLKTDKVQVSELFDQIKANPKMLRRISIRWLRPWETFFYRRSSTKKFLN